VQFHQMAKAAASRIKKHPSEQGKFNQTRNCIQNYKSS
jgi:hypothetical protein